jgi:outer membrane biosynthesis protein TonB
VRGSAFTAGQIGAAVTFAGLVQGALVVLLIISGAAGGFVPRPEPPPRAMAIAVKPMLDLPLLKKGGKPRPNRLPDMWKPPQQIKRVQATKPPPPVAPKPPPVVAPKKEDKDEKEPEPPKPEEKPPEPEAPVAKQVDESIKEVEREVEEPNLPEEGAVDGVEEGTEKDPLKARAVDLYRLKLINWFKQGFIPPLDQIDCTVLKDLRVAVNAQVAPDGTVQSYELVSSGNPVFDARVKQVMDARVGQKVPPPPPNYPDILDAVIHPTFQGKNEKCN